MGKYAVEYRINKPMGGVQLTGGALKDAFENNVNFLKKFDMDRMLYWYRVHKGKPAPGVPYAGDAGHFENNLKGQTAGEFMMGAGTALLWQEDETLRAMVQGLIAEMDECRDEDGFIIPIPREQFDTKEYPNYTRAWITFGLLDAGYAGESRAFELARDMADYFNHSNVLPYVKDLNLGFQGILANTRMYDAPNGKWEDMQVAIDHYQETWWLKQVIAGDHRAIYDHPGNHPHSTLLTTLEGYLDLYRATGEAIYIDAVKSALHMYEDKWQHVGGGINMCEFRHLSARLQLAQSQAQLQRTVLHQFLDSAEPADAPFVPRRGPLRGRDGKFHLQRAAGRPGGGRGLSLPELPGAHQGLSLSGSGYLLRLPGHPAGGPAAPVCVQLRRKRRVRGSVCPVSGGAAQRRDPAHWKPTCPKTAM